jgi:ribonuclease HI
MERIGGNSDEMAIFTDGSGYQGSVAAAAVIPQLGITNSIYMGTEKTATVYAAELKGIAMATEAILHHKPTTATIFSDSQAAIKALVRPGQTSGQLYLIQILSTLDTLQRQGIDVTIAWIPGHEGIPGNEAADLAAKQATLEREPAAEERTVKLASAAKTTFRKQTFEAWSKMWSTARTGGPTRRLIPTPTKKSLRLYRGLTKAHSSALIQLRTGRIGLNHFLHKIGVRESDRCGCDEGPQTPKHVLLECGLLANLRQQLFERIAGKFKTTRRLDYDTLVSEPRVARYVADFMVRTGLLAQFREVAPANSGEEEETNSRP